MEFNKRTFHVGMAAAEGAVAALLLSKVLHFFAWPSWLIMLAGAVTAAAIGWLAFDWREVRLAIGRWGFISMPKVTLREIVVSLGLTIKTTFSALAYFLSWLWLLAASSPCTYWVILTPDQCLETSGKAPALIVLAALAVITLFIGAVVVFVGYFVGMYCIFEVASVRFKLQRFQPYLLSLEDENVFNNYIVSDGKTKIKVLVKLLIGPLFTALGWIFIVFLTGTFFLVKAIEMVRYLHSQERAVAGFYATIGFLVGYSIQPTLIAIIAGGLIAAILSIGVYRLIIFIRQLRTLA